MKNTFSNSPPEDLAKTSDWLPSEQDSKYHEASPGYYNVVVSPEGCVLYNYEPQQGEERRPDLFIPKSEVPK